MPLFPKRTRASGRNAYTANPANMMRRRGLPAQPAVTTGGGIKSVAPVSQGRLNLPTVEVTLTVANAASPTASITPVLFDYYGTVGTRTTTNATIGGTFGTNTETVLRTISAANPWIIGRVTLNASTSGVFTTLNWKVLQGAIDASAVTQPININSLLNPQYYLQTLLIVNNLNLKLNGYIAWQFTLPANGDSISFTFNVPAETVATFMGSK